MVTVDVGVGVVADVTWPGAGVVQIVVRQGRHVIRRVRGAWSRERILAADAQIREIATSAIATRRAPPLSLPSREG